MFDLLTKQELCRILQDVLENYKCRNFVDADGDAYPLVDLLTPEGKTVNLGKDEIENIVDDFMLELINQ